MHGISSHGIENVLPVLCKLMQIYISHMAVSLNGNCMKTEQKAWLYLQNPLHNCIPESNAIIHFSPDAYPMDKPNDNNVV